MTNGMTFAAMLQSVFAASLFVSLDGVASLHTAARAAQGTSAVAGCITDTIGQSLPGVTVDVGGSGSHRVVLTSSLGCYSATNVPSGSHFVFARLPGFVSVTRDNLNVDPSQPQTVNFRMRVAPICECLAFPETLSGLWDAADTVVRVRITGHDADAPDVKHIAAVSNVWKEHSTVKATDTLTFLQRPERDEHEAYAIGQEFVLFLKWSPRERVFVRLSSGDGTVAAFAIEARRIHSAPMAAYAGMEDEQLFRDLSALASR